jgi:hypothetical protein
MKRLSIGDPVIVLKPKLNWDDVGQPAVQTVEWPATVVSLPDAARVGVAYSDSTREIVLLRDVRRP